MSKPISKEAADFVLNNLDLPSGEIAFKLNISEQNARYIARSLGVKLPRHKITSKMIATVDYLSLEGYTQEQIKEATGYFDYVIDKYYKSMHKPEAIFKYHKERYNYGFPMAFTKADFGLNA